MAAHLSPLVTTRDRVELPVAAASASGTAVVDAATLLTACLPAVHHALAFVRRRRRLSADESHDLASDVYVRLLNHDAAVLRQYRGESSLTTFLVVVIERVLLDARITRAGKWRPSASARRLGDVAIHLERLVFHEGLTLAEAGALIRERLDATHSDDELHYLLMLLPPRYRRRIVGERELVQVADAEPSSEDRLQNVAAATERRLVARALARLPEEDRRIIGLRFARGWRLCDIARARRIDEKQMYRRFQRALATLRAEIERGRERHTAAATARWQGSARRQAKGTHCS
jgi:RNA polymerase sigma factor (sigma-70 family)